jgi:hypothetical protein
MTTLLMHSITKHLAKQAQHHRQCFTVTDMFWLLNKPLCGLNLVTEAAVWVIVHVLPFQGLLSLSVRMHAQGYVS